MAESGILRREEASFSRIKLRLDSLDWIRFLRKYWFPSAIGSSAALPFTSVSVFFLGLIDFLYYGYFCFDENTRELQANKLNSFSNEGTWYFLCEKSVRGRFRLCHRNAYSNCASDVTLYRS